MDDMVHETGLGRCTALQWTRHFRDVFATYFVQNPRTIGGLGIEVEIDKTAISRRKYNVERLPGHQQMWMFAGVERESGLGFFCNSSINTTSTLSSLSSSNTFVLALLFFWTTRIPAFDGKPHRQFCER